MIKRVMATVLLGIVVFAAFFVIERFGLFNRPASARVGMGGPQSTGQGQPAGSGWPATNLLGALGGVPMIAFPGAGVGAPVMSERQIDKILADWTYPRAIDITGQYLPPGTTPEQKERLFGKYTRVVEVYGHEALVFRFYASKCSSSPLPHDFYQRIVQSTASSQPISDPRVLPPVPIEKATYSKRTRDYLIQVSLSFQVNQNHTRVILQFAPRTKSPPALGGSKTTTGVTHS